MPKHVNAALLVGGNSASTINPVRTANEISLWLKRCTSIVEPGEQHWTASLRRIARLPGTVPGNIDATASADRNPSATDIAYGNSSAPHRIYADRIGERHAVPRPSIKKIAFGGVALKVDQVHSTVRPNSGLWLNTTFRNTLQLHTRNGR